MTCTMLTVEVESGPLINCLLRVAATGGDRRQERSSEPSAANKLRFQSGLRLFVKLQTFVFRVCSLESY